MPTEASTIGAQSYPLAAGTADTAIADPVVDELLRYFAHWLNYDLNTRLANLAGVSDEAVPSGNTFGFDPGASFVRNSVPALYAWRSRERTRQWSTLQWCNDDVVTLLWVFDERDIPRGMRAVKGLMTAARNAIARAAAMGSHSTFTPTGWTAGYPLAAALSLESFGLAPETDIETGVLWKVPGDRASQAAGPSGGDGIVQSGYPSVRAQISIVELVEGKQADFPDDLNGDHDVTIYEDGADVLERILGAPDGSEQL